MDKTHQKKANQHREGIIEAEADEERARQRKASVSSGNEAEEEGIQQRRESKSKENQGGKIHEKKRKRM